MFSGLDLRRRGRRCHGHQRVTRRLWLKRHGTRGLSLPRLAYACRIWLARCSRSLVMIERCRRRRRGHSSNGSRRRRRRRSNRNRTGSRSSLLPTRRRIEGWSLSWRRRLRRWSISLTFGRGQDRSRCVEAWGGLGRLGRDGGKPWRHASLSVHPRRTSSLLGRLGAWGFVGKRSSILNTICWLLPRSDADRRCWHGPGRLAAGARSRRNLSWVVHTVVGQVIILRHGGSVVWDCREQVRDLHALFQIAA